MQHLAATGWLTSGGPASAVQRRALSALEHLLGLDGAVPASPRIYPIAHDGARLLRLGYVIANAVAIFAALNPNAVHYRPDDGRAQLLRGGQAAAQANARQAARVLARLSVHRQALGFLLT